jgi:hypothetical protein
VSFVKKNQGKESGYFLVGTKKIALTREKRKCMTLRKKSLTFLFFMECISFSFVSVNSTPHSSQTSTSLPPSPLSEGRFLAV